MTLRIRHIDAIARQEGRDVIFVIFFPDDMSRKSFSYPIPDWEALPIRKQIMTWLDTQKFSWELCGEWEEEEIDFAYYGSFYINVPYDEGNPDYQKIKNYLEYPDDSTRFELTRFCYMPLSEAMKNAHHDEPGFCEKSGVFKAVD